MIDYSIIVPSLHVESGRRTLRVFLQCLVDNTQAPYELLLSSHAEEGGSGPINQLARRARAEYLILICDDMYVAPGWDAAFTEHRMRDVLLVASLVESGNQAVNTSNLESDYGKTPETYNRAGFEGDLGLFRMNFTLPFWGFPWCVHRDTFLARGGLEADNPDPTSRHDYFFWRAWQDDGLQVRRVPSWAYHLQAWTGRDYDYNSGRARHEAAAPAGG